MNIAEKLTTVAENTPKVFNAGYKKAKETFCPPINETGMVIQCCPLEGEPFTITDVGSIVGTTVVTICGKNLYDKTTYPLDTNGYPYGSESTSKGMFATSQNYRRTGFIPVAHLAGQTIVLSHCPFATNPGMAFYTRIPNVSDSTDCKDACCGGTTGASIQVPANAVYMVFCVKVVDAEADVQIELGNVTTNYEPYAQKQYEVIAEDVLPLEAEQFKGVNTIFAYDTGDGNDLPTSVTVTGRTDPNAEIERLTNMLTAMGGNMVSATEEV